MPRRKKNKIDPYDLADAINMALVYFIQEDNQVKKDLTRGVIVRMLNELLKADKNLYEMYLTRTEEQLSNMFSTFLYPFAFEMVETLREEQAEEALREEEAEEA
jgi:hypothetical protein